MRERERESENEKGKIEKRVLNAHLSTRFVITMVKTVDKYTLNSLVSDLFCDRQRM